MMDVLEIAVGPNNEITLEIEDGLPRLALDAALFEQSILNLSLNAAAALPTGGSIIISTRLLEQEVEVSVEDNGRGMDQDAIDRAFEPYFTTRAARWHGPWPCHGLWLHAPERRRCKDHVKA